MARKLSLCFLLAGLALPAVLAAQTLNSAASVSPSSAANKVAGETKKCGVNTFRIENDCGAGVYKNMYVQCYDSYEEKQGGGSSCKSSETWQEYARAVCANRCGVVMQPAVPSQAGSSVSGQGAGAPITGQKPAAQVTPEQPVLLAPPIAVCAVAVSDTLSKEYDALISDLQKAESGGDKTRAEMITQKIISLKQEISRGGESCTTNVSQIEKPQQLQPSAVPTAATVAINRCADVKQWEEKISYYKKINELKDSDLKKDYGFSREEIKKILEDLEKGLEKVNSQCTSQNTLTTKTGKAVVLPQAITEPIKPVAAQSAEEINNYYKSEIKTITDSQTTAENQIKELKILKEEKNLLTEQFMKGRKEMEAAELNQLAEEVKVSAGQIKVGEVAVETTGKKILFNLGDKPISIEPTANGIVIKEKEKVEVKADGVSISENKLKVGNSEVKLLVSDVADKLGLSPTSVELKEENATAVYEMKVNDKRKLFGFIPLNLSKTVTADASDGSLLKEKLPWYSFITTK